MRESRSESIEDYYKIMENIPVPISVFRVETDEETGFPTDTVFTFINKAYDNVIGSKREECIGKSFSDVFHHETDNAKWNYLHWNSSHNGMTNEYENYAAPIDKYYSIIVFPIMYGYCGSILWDITIEKKFSNLIWTHPGDKESGETFSAACKKHRKSNVRDMGTYTTTILYVNTKTGKFDTLKNRDVINSAEDEEYGEFMENMKKYLSPKDYGDFEEVFSLSSIRQRQKQGTPAETELRIRYNNDEDWYRIEGIFLKNSIEGDNEDFIISFKNIGEQRLRSLRLRNTHEKEIEELTKENAAYKKAIAEITDMLDKDARKKADAILKAI